VWLPGGEKKLKIRLFVSTEYTNVTDGQSDRRTPHDSISRAAANGLLFTTNAGAGTCNMADRSMHFR